MKWVLLVAVIAAIPAFLLKTSLKNCSRELGRGTKIKVCLGIMAACIVAGAVSAKLLSRPVLPEQIRTTLMGIILISFFIIIGTIAVMNDYLKEPK